MKKNLFLVLNLGLPLVIIAYVLFCYPHTFLSKYVIGIALIALLLYLIPYNFSNRFTKPLMCVAIVFNVSYAIAEVSSYLVLSFGIVDMEYFFGGIKASDKKGFVYDSICGYRFVPGDKRYLSMENHLPEIDLIKKHNSFGWPSEREYSFTKKNQRVKRYLVLGDSYTCGTVNSVPWPDLVQRKLHEQKNDSIELYNVALDGSGLQNWSRIFKYEILPKYDFDGIIIASSSDRDGMPDFDRNFIMAHSSDATNYMQVMDATSANPPAVFDTLMAVAMAPVLSSKEMDAIANSDTTNEASFLNLSLQKPNLWLLSTLLQVTHQLHKIQHHQRASEAYKQQRSDYLLLADSLYNMEHFDRRYKNGSLLKEIISTCKDMKKEVILVGVPDPCNAFDYANGRSIVFRNEYKFIARHYGIKYFDGFEIFEGKDEAAVRKHFYFYDEHLNDLGIELFSQRLIESGVLKDQPGPWNGFAGDI
jgi:hypothetical protein